MYAKYKINKDSLLSYLCLGLGLFNYFNYTLFFKKKKPALKMLNYINLQCNVVDPVLQYILKYFIEICTARSFVQCTWITPFWFISAE